MATFKYTAKSMQGQTLNGVIDAPDEKSVIDRLRKENLIIVSVKESKGKAGGGGKGASTGKVKGGKVKLGEIVIFARQMATMLDSGIPLLQALEIMVDQIDNPVFRKAVAEVKKDVESGQSLYEAMAKHPGIFSALFINMIKAGEQSGSLDKILDRLATYLEKTDSIVHKLKSALNYPIVVISMALGITTLLLMKVVPVFEEMFKGFGGTLPLPTQLLVNMSHFLVEKFWIWTGTVVVAVFLFKKFLKSAKGIRAKDKFMLNMPIFGVIVRKVAVSKFTRTFATLLKSGVPILAALDIVSKTAENCVIEEALDKVKASIKEGEGLTAPLTKCKVFPSLVVRMISVGEQSGELEKMLSKIADFYDEQVDTAIEGITSLIEPLVIALLGTLIGGIVIAMFMPLFKMITMIN